MKIQPIEFEYMDDKERECAIRCPACGQSWIADFNGEWDLNAVTETKCPHLRFLMMTEDDEIRYFNGFSEDRLLQAIEPAARKLKPDLDGLTVEEFFEGVTIHEVMRKLGIDDLVKVNATAERHKIFEQCKESNRFNEELWKLVSNPDLDTILAYTEGGGPDPGGMVFFGVLINA